MTDQTIWQADFVVPAAAAPEIQDRLDAIPDLLDEGIYGQFEETRETVRFEIYITGAPRPALVDRLQDAAGTRLAFEPAPDEDWVTRSNEALHPFTAGRFHITPRRPAWRKQNTIIVPAGLAFGTGQHETTLGCLHLIESVVRKDVPKRAIDIGCGTGILAIALAKAGVRDITATDNDPKAITVTRENMHINRMPRPAIRTYVADGFAHPALHRKYDLVVANILARPLIEMAPALARHVAPGGQVILSGLLQSQEQEVLAAYRFVGLTRRQHFHAGEWSALLLSA